MTILFLTTLATSVLGEGELLAPGLAPEPALSDEPMRRLPPKIQPSMGCPYGQQLCPDGQTYTYQVMTSHGCQWKPCPRPSLFPSHHDYPPPSMKYPTPHPLGSAFDHMGGGRRRAGMPSGQYPQPSGQYPQPSGQYPQPSGQYPQPGQNPQPQEPSTLDYLGELLEWARLTDQLIDGSGFWEWVGSERRLEGGQNPFEDIKTFEDLAAYRAMCQEQDCPELDTLNLKIKSEYIPHLVQLVEAAKLTHDLMDGAGFWDNFSNHFGIDRRLDDAETDHRRLAGDDASRRRAVFLHFNADGSPQFGLSELASFDRDLRMFKTQMQDIWTDMQKPMPVGGFSNASGRSAPVFHFVYDIPTLTSLRMNLLKMKVKLMRQPRLFIGATYYPGQPIGGVDLDVLVDNCEDVIGLLHKTGMN